MSDQGMKYLGLVFTVGLALQVSACDLEISNTSTALSKTNMKRHQDEGLDVRMHPLVSCGARLAELLYVQARVPVDGGLSESTRFWEASYNRLNVELIRYYESQGLNYTLTMNQAKVKIDAEVPTTIRNIKNLTEKALEQLDSYIRVESTNEARNQVAEVLRYHSKMLLRIKETLPDDSLQHAALDRAFLRLEKIAGLVETLSRESDLERFHREANEALSDFSASSVPSRSSDSKN